MLGEEESLSRLTDKMLKKMYKQNRYTNNKLRINTAVEGETIEQKIERIVSNKEPIKDGAPIIFTERKDGVKPSTNIRTDRFMIAVDAADKIAKSYKARREESASKRKDGKAKPTQGTEGQQKDPGEDTSKATI